MADQTPQTASTPDVTDGSSTPFYLDKALWVTIVGPVLALLNAKFGLDLNAAEVVGMVLPIVVYIVMHKYKSGAIVTANIAAAAQVEQAKIAADAAKSPEAAAQALAGIK